MLSFWAFTSFMLHLLGAAACAMGVVWLVRQPTTKRSDRRPTMVALAISGVWAAVVAAYGMGSAAAQLAEAARNMAWLLVLYRLFAHDGRDLAMVGVRPVVVALAFVVLLQPALLYVDDNWAITQELVAATEQTSAMFHILVAIGVLVLLHNLYGGAARETREALRWSAAGLAGFWAFELNFYVVAYLTGETTPELAAMRGLVAGLMALPLTVGASNGLAGRKLQASHSVAFQTLSLLVIGGYLVLMVVAAELLSLLGGNLGRLAQIGFLVAAATVTLLWLPSQRMRGWLRVTVLKHLFQHRYDYREEWMRFTRTMGQTAEGAESLYQRSAKALADIVDSPAALLFLPGDDGLLREAASWNWRGEQRPAIELPGDLTTRLERDDYILELDVVRQGKQDQAILLPQSLFTDQDAWVLVPLIHYDRLVGVVLMARPMVPRRLDWEDFDLLRVVGRQLASYLAEHDSHSALMESAQFDDFNRRMAFVMHDIKNLASQLALLTRNAEKHADNPEFRKDMLVTLRNGADKLNLLLARLGRYGTGQPNDVAPIDLVATARRVVGRFEKHGTVTLTRADSCIVLGDAEGLEQALVHLVQNAIDASDPGMPIALDVSSDGLIGRVEVIDSGSGMDAEFLRHRLFKPFVSSKDGGFGIGAFEARELVRGMGGRLDVQSRPGVGTRFTIAIPLSEARQFLVSKSSQEAA
ncbi:XrtA/PEP-CTERM system histidine kinase PrsK [Parerythrobacter aestuarii]|uniref:XrtA/PEP-CTERM system histidine kinase PrsK n=1 Tax=Parerythrobacter aestuarii TaxID=3020909 RepID=UPI0024DEE38F|nr:XrtA/PEP-CTERM system histidine kinase PrsK [Parerythrobacter aestuarii]